MLSSEIRSQILQVCCQCDKRLCRKNCVVYISFILILITCVDGLNGFPEAISAVYPKTEVQQCIIHQIRNSTKYVSYKDIKALMADLKKVYAAVDEETALYELEQFAAKWDSKYPKISASWKAHWSELSTYFNAC